MAQDRVDRKLAAILAADVAGYSRLMGGDEEGTLARLKSHRRELIDPKVAEFHGRIVKTTGDGALVEFASAVDAVRCAVDIQRAMADRNSGVKPEQRIEFRIGINVGDVIFDSDDLYGDGVNVAARLEALADPGGIYVSRAVRDQVRDKLAFELEDLGEQSVKNIERPVRIFKVKWTPLGGVPAPRLSDKPSIAVLPFTNMSGDPEQEYFSDGISEDVITDLSKISGLIVIARNSSFVYKGKAVSVPQVSRELGVRYVLEGSVRKSGNRVRVNAQLIDGATGAHSWAERYDRDLTDIFTVQDDLTKEIVGALALKLTRADKERLDHRSTTSVEAYEYFLRGREQMWLLTRTGCDRAKELIARAIEIDPNFSAAYAVIGFVAMLEYINGWSPKPDDRLKEAYELAEKAVRLDDREPFAHMVLGSALLWMREHERAMLETERALALDPNFAAARISLGLEMHYSGRYEEALVEFDRALQLDPHFPEAVLQFLAQTNLHLGRYDEAADYARQRIARNPQTDASRVVLAACLGHLGRTDEAQAEWRDMMRINPSYSFEHRRRVLPYKDPAQINALVEGLAKAGIEV